MPYQRPLFLAHAPVTPAVRGSDACYSPEVHGLRAVSLLGRTDPGPFSGDVPFVGETLRRDALKSESSVYSASLLIVTAP